MGLGVPLEGHLNFTVLAAGTACSFFSIFSGDVQYGATAAQEKPRETGGAGQAREQGLRPGPGDTLPTCSTLVNNACTDQEAQGISLPSIVTPRARSSSRAPITSTPPSHPTQQPDPKSSKVGNSVSRIRFGLVLSASFSSEEESSSSSSSSEEGRASTRREGALRSLQRERFL